MAFIDPTGSNPISPSIVNPGMSSGVDAASATSAAMVQPRAAPIGRALGGFDRWSKAYSGAFHGFPTFSMATGMHRGAQTILRQGYNEHIPIGRGFGTLGTSINDAGEHIKGKAFRDFRSNPLGSARGWANRETYGVRTMATKFPQSFTRFDSTSIYDTEHDMLNWNPWQLSTNVNPLLRRLPGMQGQNAFTPGTMGMASASSSLFKMGDSMLSPTMSQGISSTIAYTNPSYAASLGMVGNGVYGPAAPMVGTEANYALLGANSGMISSRAAGLFAGAKAGFSGSSVPSDVLEAARGASIGGANFANTAEWATGAASRVNEAGGVIASARAASAEGGLMSGLSAFGEGSLVSSASGIGTALPMLGAASTVIQAGALGFGIGAILKKPIQAGIGFASDGLTSARGSIQKPIFGAGFRDTEATLTARQRGVQAIQNSRLNARSFLGSESVAMWSHFG